jgi:hypothetical protein
LEVFGAEARAAFKEPDADACGVRKLAREGLLAVGPGTEAIPGNFRDWRVLRPALAVRQETARRVAAISRWRAADIDTTRIADWMNSAVRKPNDAARMFSRLRNHLAGEIATRGDKRITEPAAIATAFIADVERGSQSWPRKTGRADK